MEELIGTFKVHEIELNEDEGQRKGKNPVEIYQTKTVLKKTVLMKTNFPSSQERYNPCGRTREDQDERTTSRSTARKLKTRCKWCHMNVRNQDI
ncbi:hypothetical protein CR513_10295, partial [Mucuna pruriens]